MARLQRETTPSSLTSHVDALDPAVERGILRCLETDPARRPDSALAVAAGLPGGDPLAAALAAGETPSPAMVAEAGTKGGLRPAAAVTFLIPILLGLAAVLVYGDRMGLPHQIPLTKPPAELALDARKIVEVSGWTDPPADLAFGFDIDSEYFDWVQDNDSWPDWWAQLSSVRPVPVWYWYRQSGSYLVPANHVGFVGPGDPPSLASGMVDVRLDPEGRLQRFQAIAPKSDDTETPVTGSDWAAFFEFSGLESTDFDKTVSTWNPVIGMDARQAWTGHYPGDRDHPVRVEAGSFRGRPVYFEVIPEWRQSRAMVSSTPSLSDIAAGTIVVSMVVLLFGGASLLAWRNDRQGRGDRRGALRLATFVAVVQMLRSLLRINHVPSIEDELLLVTMSVALALFGGAVIWLFYMAAEPYVRRLWPDSLIAWTRLLDGRFRDPLLGMASTPVSRYGIVAGIQVEPLQKSFCFARLELDEVRRRPGSAVKRPGALLPIIAGGTKLLERLSPPGLVVSASRVLPRRSLLEHQHFPLRVDADRVVRQEVHSDETLECV